MNTTAIGNQEIKKIQPNQATDKGKQDWVECTLGEIVTYSKGKKPKVLKIIPEEGIDIPYINIKAFEKGIFSEYTDGVKCNLCNEGDLLMVWDGARAGLTGKAKKGAVGSTLMKIEPINTAINKEYLYYFLLSKYILLNTNPRGVGIPHVEPSLLWNSKFIIYISSLQRAIVKKIEELFSSLDSGITDLKKAQEQLVIYRQAVLKKAFEGVKDFKSLKECGEWKGGGTPSRQVKKYWENGTIPWVSSRDVKTKEIHDTERHITEIAIPNSSTKWIDKDSLLFVMRSGILRRIFPIAIAKVELCVNQDIQTVSLDDNWIPEYVYWFLVGNESDIRHNCSKDGTTVESIDSNLLKSYLVPFCSIQDQKRIIKDIESRLSVCDKVEESITESLEKAQALRQSILKKAFEGKLLSKAEIEQCKQEKDYEPASVLLERIKKEKKNKK